MKRITMVLVLLLAFLFASSPLLVPSAQAGEIQKSNSQKTDSSQDTLVDLLGEPDDDGKGDPGNMGDGFGATGGPEFTLGEGGMEGNEQAALEEYLLLLMLMIQQLAP